MHSHCHLLSPGRALREVRRGAAHCERGRRKYRGPPASDHPPSQSSIERVLSGRIEEGHEAALGSVMEVTGR
jgi:hypothetical protein